MTIFRRFKKTRDGSLFRKAVDTIKYDAVQVFEVPRRSVKGKSEKWHKR